MSKLYNITQMERARVYLEEITIEMQKPRYDKPKITMLKNKINSIIDNLII